MKYWNTSGDVTVLRGEKTGYGTEACFSTSYMWSSKNQEINLLDYFTAEYLDTAPDIQVILEAFKNLENTCISNTLQNQYHILYHHEIRVSSRDTCISTRADIA